MNTEPHNLPSAESVLAALMESEHRLRLALRGEILSATIQDADLRYIWAENMPPDWDATNFLGLTDLDLLGPDRMQSVIEGKQHTLATGEPYRMENWYNQADGSRIYLRVTSERHRLPDGESILLNRSVDLTEQKLGEERNQALTRELEAKVGALQESERRLQATLAGSPLSAFLQNANLAYVWTENMHPAWQDVDWYALDDFARAEINPVFVPLLARKRNILATGKEDLQEGWFEAGEGVSYYFRYTIEPFTFADGTVGLLGTSLDLTHQKRAELRALGLAKERDEQARNAVQAERQLTLALEGTDLALFIQDEHLLYIWERNAVQIFGPILGMTDYDIIIFAPEFDPILKAKKRCLATGEPQNAEGWLRTPRGEQRFYQIGISPHTFADGTPGILGRALDLTAQKLQARELETELERKREEIEEVRLLHESLRPRILPCPGIYAIATYSQASAEVGGDYYDFHQLAPDSALVALGDVTGHGMKAGLLVSMVKSYFQLLAGRLGPAKLLDRISTEIETLSLSRMYLGLITLELRPGVARYAMGGMPPMFHYSAGTGAWQQVGQQAMFLGTGLRLGPYKEAELPLATGDYLVLATDGLSESIDTEAQMLGSERIMAHLSHTQPTTPEVLVEGLRILQSTHTGLRAVEDDTVIVAIKVL